MSAIPVAEDVLDADVPVLSLKQAAEALSQSTNKLRQMVRDGHLIAVRRDGDIVIPEVFLSGNALLKGLPGTITVLQDAGFGSTEILRWLFTEDETLPGTTPINALAINHGTEVKRRAQAMAF